MATPKQPASGNDLSEPSGCRQILLFPLYVIVILFLRFCLGMILD